MSSVIALGRTDELSEQTKESREQRDRRRNAANTAPFTVEHYEVRSIPGPSPSSGRVKVGYRSGENERTMWQYGADPSKLSSNTYPSEFQGLYVEPNKPNMPNYGSQTSEVFLPKGTEIVKVEGGLCPTSNPKVHMQIKLAKAVVGQKAVIEGIIDPKNKDLNSRHERIIPKKALSKANIQAASESIVEHSQAPTKIVKPGKKVRTAMKAMPKQAGIIAVTHIIDHHIFKDAQVSQSGGRFAEASTSSNAGYANATYLQTSAGTMNSTLGDKAFASASVAEARAATEGIPGTGGLCAAFAEAKAPSASAQAEASVMGAMAVANANVAHVRAGFEGTPLQVSATGPGVLVGAGVHVNMIGARVGAHLGEATAGPFAVRAGLTFGGGIENGVPVLHLGPVSTPCSIM